ncbi:hypothetical protein CHRY9390_02317 [Chryseobacterium aquaeductus]|uniref:EpsG family protein n=1 Tax=Chryseobacterium aquaeductus TaxID=2675056 RepID=A0A9N8QSZ8_9FLAO|nr:EpsG family protein [Chryseobacterium aquaeductus]CAA7331604.1 hypothetical protein CHRY9390_02317 [Chryseobacterium potabilaquae]CAD7811200.1 hypothetical protein CHRY9390_02317 [Chryseobacterium aquaeductus]
MLYYLVPYIFITFLSLNIYFKKQKISWQIILFFLLPSILIVGLRGNVGTDTVHYLAYLEDIHLFGDSLVKFEPGFKLLNKFIIYLGATPRLGVAIIGMISISILCAVYSRSKNEMILFSLVVYPLFFFDFTMNGMRYGLSFCLATIAIDALYRKKYWHFAIWGITAFTIQYSSLLLILLFLSVLVKKKYIIIFSIILGGFILIFPNMFAFFMDSVADKQNAYGEVYAPGFVSGLAPLLVVLFLYSNFLYFKKNKNYSKLIHFVVIFEIVSFIIAKFTYAGLRLQGVFLYGMILFLKNNTTTLQVRRQYIFNLSIVSVFSILLFFKNISNIVEGDVSPFLPYKFFWEENNK